MLFKNETTTPFFEFCDPVILHQIHNKSDLKYSDFEVRKIIGTGSFSTVKLVGFSYSHIKAVFALKIASKSELIKTKHWQQIQEEKEIAQMVNHPFLVKFVRTFQDDLAVYFLFEFVNGGEIFQLLSQKHHLQESWVQFYSAETLLALQSLHSKKIIYRDLKTENVMISKSGHVKLVDFGFSKVLENGRCKTLCGTPEYMAPEMLFSKNGYDFSVDFWAFGILIFELAVGFGK